MEKPTQLNSEDINIDELKNLCQKYIDFLDDDEEYYEDNVYDQYIFEKTLETIYGKDVWDFVNNRQE